MRRLCWLVVGLLLAGCGTPVTNLPTLPPVIHVTTAPTQDVGGTATALAESARATPTPPGLYVVREGDTLDSIANAFNTTIEELAATNRISDVNTIFVGQPLIIPSLLTSSDGITETDDLQSVESPTPAP